MMRRTLFLAAMLFIAPCAITEPAYSLECRTLSGAGVVRLHLAGVIYEINIDCGVRT